MPAAYKRCLKHVKGKVKSPHGVCTASNAGNVKAVRKREADRRKKSRKFAERTRSRSRR